MKILNNIAAKDFGPFLDIKAAVTDSGFGGAAVLRKVEGNASHPPTIGGIPGCGTIIPRHDNSKLLDVTSHDEECMAFLVPVSRNNDGLYTISASNDSDYIWVPDKDALDSIRRVALDNLRKKYGATTDFKVNFNQSGGFSFTIEGEDPSSYVFPSHNLAYIAASEKILSRHGINLTAQDNGTEFRELMDAVINDYARDVIREYNDWLSGETYEVFEIKFNGDLPSTSATQTGEAFRIVGKDYAELLLHSVFNRIANSLSEKENMEQQNKADDSEMYSAPTP